MLLARYSHRHPRWVFGGNISSRFPAEVTKWAKSYNLSGSPTPTGRPVLFKRRARYTRASSRPRSPVPRQSGMTILRPDLFSRKLFQRAPVSSRWRKVLRSLGDAKRRPRGAPQSADLLDRRKNLPQRHQLPEGAPFEVQKPIFIGFFGMARRLLINRCGNERPRYAAFVGALSCCLPLALRRPHWTPSNR
jgi:hypothetical protein